MDEQERMRFFYDIFDSSLPRLGPGDDFSTRKALRMALSAKYRGDKRAEAGRLRALDIGCGNGAQTLVLAREVDGIITAVDNHQPFLDELQRRAEVAGVSDKIRPLLQDMRDVVKGKEPFDLIWSEGALYIMGFREGLAACRDLLVSDGMLCASEICWFKPDPPAECVQFFADECPAMVDLEMDLTIIKDCGYKILGRFNLPESAWWESYYRPLERRLELFREAHATDPERIGIIESIQAEVEIYRRYSDYYGYTFFVLQRP